MTQHPTYATAFPPAERTFTGRVMMALATHRENAIPDLVFQAVDDADVVFPSDPMVRDLDQASAQGLADQVIDAYDRAVPAPTPDAEALQRAFADLADQRVAVSFGDGWDAHDSAVEAHERAEQLPGARGYAYCSVQDLERAVETGRLFIGFSDMAGDLGAAAVAVGEQVAAALGSAGLPVTWAGTGRARIEVGPIVYAVPRG